jgi:hypothetical protein
LIGHFAADVNQRASSLPQVFTRDTRPIHDTPEIRFEESPHVNTADLEKSPVDGYSGVVHPGIESTKRAQRLIPNPTDVGLGADIGDDGDRLSALTAELLNEL